MKMKSILRALSLALIMMLLTATAFAWTCPSCGTENSSNFCGECGTKKPEEPRCPGCNLLLENTNYRFCPECGTALTTQETAAPATAVPAADEAVLEFTDAQITDIGSTRFSWTDTGNTPYTFSYLPKYSEDFSADEGLYSSLGLQTVKTPLNVPGINTGDLVPGQAYWLIVKDSAGNVASTTFEPAPVVKHPTFSAFTLLPTTTTAIGGEPEFAESFSVDQILSDDVVCGTYVTLFYDYVSDTDFNGLLTLTITAPTGAVQNFLYGVLTLSAGEGQMYNGDNYPLTDYFAQLLERYDTIPVGDYTVDTYINGMLASDPVTFTVTEKAAAPAATAAPTQTPAAEALTITSVTENADGTLTVSWADPKANGPYYVLYMQQLSATYDEDIEREDNILWRNTDEGAITGLTDTLNYTVPGQPHWIVVRDADSNEAVTLFTPAATTAFTAHETSLTLYPQSKDAEGTITAWAALSQETLAAQSPSLYIELHYSGHTGTVDLPVKAVITNPAGLAICDGFWMENISDEYSYTYWDEYSLDWYFQQVADDNGVVPQGEYTFAFYTGNQLLGEATFSVVK